MSKDKVLTVEEAARKEKMRVRLIWLMVIVNLGLVAYIIYSIVTLAN